MTTWNYRVYRHINGEEEWYEIHEAYYESGEDTPTSWTEEGVSPIGSTKEELIDSLEKMLEAAKNKPVLEYGEKYD